MVQNLNLGPPLTGLPTLKSSLERNSKDARSDSFGKSLEQISSKAPKEMSAQKPLAKDEAVVRKPSETQASQAGPGASRSQPEVAKADRKDSDTVEDPKDPLLRAEKGKPLGEKLKVADREKAIKKFMDSFESEFGIPPTRLVEAIANLDEADQMKAPEDTVDAVVNQLGLDDKEQDRARAMYASLLIDLSKSPVSQQVSQPSRQEDRATMAGAGQNFGQEFRQRVRIASDQRSMTNMGVDRLNQKFWMKPGAEKLADNALSGMGNPSHQALSRLMMDDSLDPKSQYQGQDLGQDLGQDQAIQDISTRQEISSNGKGPLELPPHLRGQLEQNATPAMIAALAAKIQQLRAAQGAQESAGEQNPIDEGEVPDEAIAGKSNFESLLKKPETQTSGGLGALFSSAAGEGNSGHASQQSHSHSESQDSFAKSMSGQKENLKSSEKTQQKVDFKQTMKGLEAGANPQGLPKPEGLPKSDFALGGGAVVGQQGAAKGEETTNIRQLMNQAQYLIKKGGGEMKVEMTPEGLGPVHLKVLVMDGKVNVQMSATTDEAKKTIENSLADLKTSLAAHKLSVDHVKVDVVNGTSTDVATNNQQNMDGRHGEQGQRDSTQRFWNQFNENFGSQSQRESFLDVTNLKGYGQSKKDPLQPIEMASQSRTVSGKGRELNLVA